MSCAMPDESEPGTIKDRFILDHLPHLVAEGMMIAGLVTGARKGILYIRHDYPLQEEIFGEELRRCVKAGLLGKKILGSELDFTLEDFAKPRRIHLRRRKRAAGGDRGSPGGAAEQAAVPGRGGAMAEPSR